MPKFEDYKIVVYQQKDGVWAGYIPSFRPYAIAMKDTPNELISELKLVFEDVVEEYNLLKKPFPKSDIMEIKIA